MKKILFILSFLIPLIANGQIITTVAGGGTYLGDNGPATAARINDPTQLCFDKFGNLYIPEGNGNRVRKIDTAGIITTIAGTGVGGYSGDGGAATAARLKFPDGIAIDGAGNIFIADFLNQAIRRVDAITGIITTICGNGISGYSGDGGPATAAKLAGPNGICFDAIGNLYIADCNNNVIRKIDTSGIIRTFAGKGEYGYNGDNVSATNAKLYLPTDMVIDNSGNVYIADGGNHRIRKVNPSGIISTYAGNGIVTYIGDGMSATSAQFSSGFLKFDLKQDLYITDGSANRRVYKIDQNTGKFHTIAGNGSSSNYGDGGPATAASFSGFPCGIAFDQCNNLYIGNVSAFAADSDRIRKITYNPPPCDYLETTGVHSQQNISIYPNPTNDELHIENTKPGTKYDVVSIIGAVVHCGTLKAKENTISIRNLPPGIYLLALTNEQGARTVHKIIKE